MKNVINRKFNVVFVEYQIYFTRKAEFCDILTRAAHMHRGEDLNAHS